MIPVEKCSNHYRIKVGQDCIQRKRERHKLLTSIKFMSDSESNYFRWQLHLQYKLPRLWKSELLGEKVLTITCKEMDMLINLFIKNNYLETRIHFQWDVGILLNVTYQSPIRESPSWRDAFYKQSYSSKGNFLECPAISNHQNL